MAIRIEEDYHYQHLSNDEMKIIPQNKFVSLEKELEDALDEPRFNRLVYHDAAW